MSKILKIGVAGCGAIGSSLAKALKEDFSPKAQVSAVYDNIPEKAYKLAREIASPKSVVLSLDELINKSDLVIEATKAWAAFNIAKKALLAGKDILIMSVGGIIEQKEKLSVIAQKKNARLYVPSGAICGIDAVKAASCGKIKRIVLTTKKPPKAFLGVPYVLKRKIRLDTIDKDTPVFEGNALSAVRTFPQNINVAATLSLAGLGPKETLVRIIASPGLTKNVHEVEIEAESGTIFTRSENIPHPDNAKTSYLAVLSAIATLKQILEPIKIGT